MKMRNAAAAPTQMNDHIATEPDSIALLLDVGVTTSAIPTTPALAIR